MRAMPGPEQGFTVMEVVIALVLLAVGLMSAAAMQTHAVDQTNASNRRSQRIEGAERWMEDIMRRAVRVDSSLGIEVADIFSDNCTGSRECNSGDWFDAPQENSRYPYRVRYRVFPEDPLPNLVTIEVQAIPTGSSAKSAAQQERKTITLSYVRSMRWN